MSGRPADIALRPATPADDAFFVAVYADTRREELDPVPWSDDQKAAFLASQFAAQSAHYAQHYEGATHDVVLVDGVPAGRLILLRTEREVRVVDIALLRAHRGRGVGTRLLQLILDGADGTGRVVSIHVEHLNPAMDLYRRLGFVPAGDAGVYVRMERPPQRCGDGVTRRHLLQSGAAVGATFALAGARGATPARAQDLPPPLKRSTFTGQVGSGFTTRTAAGATVTLVLTEVTDLVRVRHDPALTGSEDAFALAFEGPPDAVVPQGIHTLAHGQLDAVDVFIVPVGRAGESQRYELVVDRSVPAATASRVAPEPLERSTAAAATEAGGGTGPTTPPEAPAPRPRPGPAPASPGRRPGRVRRATVTRRGGVLAADVVLDPARPLSAVRVTLRRGDVTYASASRRLHGRAALRLVLRVQRHVSAGEYTLTVTTVDRAGRRATARVRAWLNR